MNKIITREARRFAIQELARRAGADASEWIVEISDSETSVYLDETRGSKLTFPHLVREFDPRAIHTVRCSWLSQRGGVKVPTVPNFVIPFCATPGPDLAPLFAVEGRRLRCRVDLTASVLYSLCRIEERLSTERDQHGRFPASASIASREDYLYRPIVDEYGLGLAEAIQYVLPGWQPRPKQFRVFITQDVDSVGIPFDLWSTASRLAHTWRLGGALRDTSALFRLGKSAELQAVSDIATLASSHGFRSACFWKTAARTRYDTAYNVRLPLVSDLISELREADVEIGVHPSYETFINRHKLTEEVNWLRESFGQDRVGGRQHYLRWCPETWSDWESCGLAYDSSVGFAEKPGFRAGTALPYRPWLLDENREANLLEIPLILMDGTLRDYMRLSDGEALALTSELIARIKAVGGVFTLLWHNEMLLSSQFRGLYQAVLEQLEGSAPYDLASELRVRRVGSAA